MSKQPPTGMVDQHIAWTVRLVAEPAVAGDEVRLESMADLLRALPSPEASVSWQARRYVMQLPVHARDVAAALQNALAAVEGARREIGLPHWPVTSTSVGRAADEAMT